MNNNHNTHFYSLEETKRILETTKEFEDGEQIYYFIGGLRYLYDELNKQKEVLDKIKQILESNLSNMEKLVAINIMLKKDELLEEIK